MPRELEDITALSLRTTPSNVKKALKLREGQSEMIGEKREALEKLFADVQHTYDRACDDVRIRGEVLIVTKYTSKGHPYEVEQVNPYLRIQQKATAQLASLASQLAKIGKVKSKSVVPGSLESLYPELFEAAS